MIALDQSIADDRQHKTKMNLQFGVFAELTVRIYKKLEGLETMKSSANVADTEIDEEIETGNALIKLDEDLSGESLADALFNSSAALRNGLAQNKANIVSMRKHIKQEVEAELTFEALEDQDTFDLIVETVIDKMTQELNLGRLAQTTCTNLLRGMQVTAKARKAKYIQDFLLEAKNGKRKKTLQILTGDLIQDLQCIPDYTTLSSIVVAAESEELALTFTEDASSK